MPFSQHTSDVVTLSFIICIIVGYLLGSVPTGYVVARARGIDIRTVGSGNIGATNVFRILGAPVGVFVLLVDAAKGWLSVFLGLHFTWTWFGIQGDVGPAQWLAIAAGIAAILGHNYTFWLRFKGGKGIATSAGVMIGLVPQALLIALAVWIVVFALSRYVSLASISAAFALPFAVWLSGYSVSLIVITAVLASLAIYKHKSNIQRLLKGTENRIGKKKPAAAQ